MTVLLKRQSYLLSCKVALLTVRNKIKLSTKLAAEYRDVQTLPPVLAGQQAGPAGPKRPAGPAAPGSAGTGMRLIGGPETGSTCVEVVLSFEVKPLMLVQTVPLQLPNRDRWSNSDINKGSRRRVVRQDRDYRRH